MTTNLPTNCKYCSSQSLVVRHCQPSSPHAAGVWCESCERWQKWLSKPIAASLGLGGEQ
jgi:hypothetical protein